MYKYFVIFISIYINCSVVGMLYIPALENSGSEAKMEDRFDQIQQVK